MWTAQGPVAHDDKKDSRLEGSHAGEQGPTCRGRDGQAVSSTFTGQSQFCVFIGNSQ
jgi:hypothetical protein